MKQIIPYKKLSKKKRREMDAKLRVTWGFSPVTRRKENAKAYNRKKAKQMDEASPDALPFFAVSFPLWTR